MNKLETEGTDICMTAAAAVSSLGCEARLLGDKVRAKQRGLSLTHRFRDWTEAPLGEIPWAEMGIRVGDPMDSDALLRQGCQVVFGQVVAAAQLFQRHKPDRLGLFVGTTTCGLTGLAAAAARFAEAPGPFEPLLKPEMQQAWVGEELAALWDIRGPVYTLSSSCAASAQAFGLAFDAVRAGWVDAAVVLGADVLSLVTLSGFDALQILDHDWCKPFAPERAGINLAEAIAAVVLERSSGREVLARVKGYACVSEAYHMTQPAPNGRWMQESMRRALSRAGITPDDVSYLNPHGTGTEANDAAEWQAISELFGNTALLHPTKGLTGHSLGASGVLELIITAAMLGSERRIGLKNSFGFGGANVSLVLAGGGG